MSMAKVTGPAPAADELALAPIVHLWELRPMRYEEFIGRHQLLGFRPEGRRLFDMLRSGDTLVVRWIDRLGRNYKDVTDTIRKFMRRGVTVRTIINGMVFDGQATDPMSAAVRDARIGFMAAMGQSQAEATKEAQRAGIAVAKAKSDAASAYKGRKPSFTAENVATVADMAGKGMGVAEIARITGLSRQTVYGIKDDPAAAQAALAAWA